LALKRSIFEISESWETGKTYLTLS
jgi:hypothetical protein